MLLEFTVGNFRSFKERNTLSMVASPLTARIKRVDAENAFSAGGDLSILKVAAVYGANASGKSNLVLAMQFLRNCVLNSSRETQADEPIAVEPFRLHPDRIAQPAHFEVVFSVEQTTYRYGFEVTREAIAAEWLFHAPKGKEAKLFTRDGTNIEVGRAFAEGRSIIERTRPNALFLSVVAQFNGPLAVRLVRWFRGFRIISGLDDSGYVNYTLQQCERDDEREKILRLIRRMDVGIDDIRVEKQKLGDSLPKGLPPELKEFLLQNVSEDLPRLSTLHGVFNDAGERVSSAAFNLEEHESEGTKKLFALSGPILDTLTNGTGRVLIIDELDARMHPLLTRAILRLFQSPRSNKNNAQLVFTTHDLNLLKNELFRRDQFWFTKKNRYGATELISLAEFKGVRNDVSLTREYEEGRFGAIPFVGDLEAAVEDTRG